MKTVLALLLGVLIGCASAQAMSLREMRAMEQADATNAAHFQYYLVGVMEGVLEADQVGQRQGRKPLLCPPKTPEPRQADVLFRAELRRNQDLYEADMPVELVMSNALAGAYRCKN